MCRVVNLGGKCHIQAERNSRVMIQTPGGGGFGIYDPDNQNEVYKTHERFHSSFGRFKSLGSWTQYQMAQEQA